MSSRLRWHRLTVWAVGGAASVLWATPQPAGDSLFCLKLIGALASDPMQAILDDTQLGPQFRAMAEERAEKMLGRRPSQINEHPESRMFRDRGSRAAKRFTDRELEMHDPTDLNELHPNRIEDMVRAPTSDPLLGNVTPAQAMAAYEEALAQHFAHAVKASPFAAKADEAKGIREAAGGLFVAVHPGPGTMSKEIERYLKSHPELADMGRLALVNENNPITDPALLNQLSAVSYSFSGSFPGAKTDEIHLAGGHFGACMHETLMSQMQTTFAEKKFSQLTAVFHCPVVQDSTLLGQGTTLNRALRAAPENGYEPLLSKLTTLALAEHAKEFDVKKATYARVVNGNTVDFIVQLPHLASGKTLRLVLRTEPE